MPDLFAGPYVFLEPDFAFVLDDGWTCCRHPGSRPRPRLDGDVLRRGGAGRAGGVHVTVMAVNVTAIGFYRRLGRGL